MRRFILALICFLLAASPVAALDLTLATPIPRQSITHIWVGIVRAYPDKKFIEYELILGYKDNKQQLIEISRSLREIRDPTYTAMQALFSTSGKPVEQVILEQILTEFPGVIQ